MDLRTSSQKEGSVEAITYIVNDFDFGDEEVTVRLESPVQCDAQCFGGKRQWLRSDKALVSKLSFLMEDLACKFGKTCLRFGRGLGRTRDVDVSNILDGMDSSICSTSNHEGHLIVNDLFESFLTEIGRTGQVRGCGGEVVSETISQQSISGFIQVKRSHRR